MMHILIFACETHFFHIVDMECGSSFDDVPLMEYPLTLNHRQFGHRPLVYESNGKLIIPLLDGTANQDLILMVTLQNKIDQNR